MRKITEAVRASALKRVDGELVPSTTFDTDIRGFALVVTTRRAFWCLVFRPKGVNPATGKRWGGGVRLEIGDAFMTSIADARAAALKAKGLVRQGHDPHRQAMASQASAVAARSVLPTSLSETLDAYEKAILARREPSEASRRQQVHYARKAIRVMNVEALAPAQITPSTVRLMVETTEGSAAERKHVFGALSRFLAWCRKQGLIEHNPCADLDRAEKPRQGKPRTNVPTLMTLRAVWAAVEDEPQRDLVRFLLLVPLRREEAAGLLWSEVDLEQGRVTISADRMRKAADHQLPLSSAALDILKGRQTTVRQPLVFASGAHKPFDGWTRLTNRIRARIRQTDTARSQRFSFHDIRRSFASLLAERGFDVDLLDGCLSHRRPGVKGVYQRALRMAERQATMNAWASLLLDDAPAANVVQLAARR